MLKLFKPVWLAVMLALTISIFAPVSICAVDTSQAAYTVVIRVTNNGTSDAYNVSVPVTLNTAYLISGGYMASNFSNTAMLDNWGNSTAYNPGVVANTTMMIFVPSIPASSSLDYRFYLGGSRDMAGNLSLFPGTTTGLTTADSASMELGNNFSITQSGFLDTSYAADKNLIAKTGALVVNVTGTNTINATYGINKTQLQANSGVFYDSDGLTRVAQNLTAPAMTVTSVAFVLSKYLVPTGLGHATIRNGSDGSLVGNLGSVDVSTLAALGSPTWIVFNSTPVTVPAGNYYIGFEYYGGDLVNRVYISNTNTSVIANENRVYYLNSNWMDFLDKDLSYIILGSITNSATGVDTGKHNIEISNYGLYVDGVLKSSNGSFANNISLTNNSNAWSFAQNQCWTYLENQSVVVNGVEVQNISWQNAAIWVDGSGHGNNATPTFRTTTTNPNVSAVIVDVQVEHEAILTDWDVNAYSGDSPVPAVPSQMYDTMNATFPGHGIIDDVEASGDVPKGMLWFLIPTLIILLISLLIHDKTKSLFAQFGVMAIMMIFISLAHVWALWMIIPFGLMAGACLVSSKVFAV